MKLFKDVPTPHQFRLIKAKIDYINIIDVFLPPANEVRGKVIFSEACVKNSVHGGVCLSACWDTNPYPPMQTPPPGAGPPQEQTPPRSRPPGGKHLPEQTPPPGSSACWEIRPTSGRCASYWNAFLCSLFYTGK